MIIYTHVLNRARRVLAARLARLDEEVSMLIRITYRDKCLDGQNAIEGRDSIVPLVGYPKASYADRKPEFRIFCGSL
jgi:hypothetical protein